MTRTQKFLRLGLTIALLGSLGACTVVPAYPVGYRQAPPAYTGSYPSYDYSASTVYYEPEYREYHDHGRRYRDERRHYHEPRRIESPLEGAARLHRDIRRSLGLPRLPGMP